MQKPLSSVPASECDREPIHVPGTIQPFGTLLAFALPTWTIEHVSADAPALFGAASAEAMIGSPVDIVFPSKVIHDLRNTFQATMISGQPERLLNVKLGREAADYDILVHGSGQLAVAECIPLAGADTPRADSTILVKTIFDRLRRTTTFPAFLTSAARQLRAVTGFDRVMIYKFLEDDSGKVVAEALRAGMAPFLDLHYPASDIPAQARALFLRQWLRMIPDVGSTQVPVVPAMTAKGVPLDLSLSALRSASPIHLQYLRNMGVGASLTVSIIVGDRLWGLIACHHETMRRIASSTCAAVDLFAQVFSSQIEARQQKDELAYSLKARDVLSRLISAMAPEETIFENLRSFSPLLKEMIACDGIGVWSGERFESDGAAPPATALPELYRFLNSKPADRCFATDALGKVLPDAMAYADQVSGVVAIPFSRSPRDFVLLFRREIVQTVNWGGDPKKAVQADGAEHKLTPRTSFAAWKELVRGRSIAWRPAELDTAESFRISLLDVILRRADLIDRERRTAQESQLLIVAELNHRVKNVLAVILSLVRQSRHNASSTENFGRDLEARIHGLSVAHDQLTLAHWKAAPLRGLIEVEAQAWTETADTRLVLTGPPVLVEARAYQTIALVLHELMTNAAKYGALSAETGRLAIDWAMEPSGDLALRWRESGGPAVKAPQRRGFGSIVVEQSIPFELRGEAAIDYHPAGVCATFKIPSEFVQPAASEPSRPELPVARRADLTGKNLLLVEDSMMIALDAQAMLQSCGAEIELAATTSDARRALKLNTFDAAILDVNLYTETSFPIADDLQKLDIPFVFATGYGETVSVPERFKHIHVLSKPYAEDALRAALTV